MGCPISVETPNKQLTKRTIDAPVVTNDFASATLSSHYPISVETPNKQLTKRTIDAPVVTNDFASAALRATETRGDAAGKMNHGHLYSAFVKTSESSKQLTEPTRRFDTPLSIYNSAPPETKSGE